MQTTYVHVVHICQQVQSKDGAAVTGERIRPLEPGKPRKVAVRCAKRGTVFQRKDVDEDHR